VRSRRIILKIQITHIYEGKDSRTNFTSKYIVIVNYYNNYEMLNRFLDCTIEEGGFFKLTLFIKLRNVGVKAMRYFRKLNDVVLMEIDI